MISDPPPPVWSQRRAGLWSTEVAGHKIVASHDPGLYPRGWRVMRDGEHLTYTQTLRGARQWVEGNFCHHRWNVNYSGHHWYMSLCVEGPGRYTHFEARAACKRRQANGETGTVTP